jgi:DHA1 family tetracycline resistance protein-like MFS transporter
VSEPDIRPSPPAASAGRRASTTVFLTILLDLVGFGMLLPLLPFYALKLNASPARIGLLFAAYSVTQLLFSPVLGWLSDRVGRRPVMLVSILGNVAAHLMFATAGSFALLVLARALAGVAASNYSIAQAWMADVTTAENRSKAMGLVGAAFGIGFVVGPGLGSILALTPMGAPAVPYAAAALSGLNFLLALVWLPESLPPEVRKRRQARPWIDPAGFLRMWDNGSLRGLMLLFFLVMFCFSLFEATLALYCHRLLGFDEHRTSLLFVYVGIVLAVVQGGLLGRLIRAFGERRLILGGIALMAVGLTALPLYPSVALVMVSLLILAVGSGVHNPSVTGLLSKLADDDSQGSTIGFSRSSGALARIFGPVTGTWIFGRAGPAWPFLTAGALMLVALVIAWGLLRRVGSTMS